MFESVKVPVLGIVENMSFFICDSCDKEHEIFGKGGGERMEQQFGVPLLSRIPMQPALVMAGDKGEPLSHFSPNHPANKFFKELVGKIAARLSQWSVESENALFEYEYSFMEEMVELRF